MSFTNEQFRLDGKVAVVTGAGGRGNSIGRAYALGLANAGAAVVVADLNAEGAARVAEEILDNGGKAIAAGVDTILLDSGNQNLAVKELGGTGRKHDWRISRQIVAAVKIPVYLAGGLNPDNVAEAIAQVQPFGLDICSGLRTNGQLDEVKVQRFFAAIATATH